MPEYPAWLAGSRNKNAQPMEVGRRMVVVDFTQKENRHLQPVRVWAESIAISRQSWPYAGISPTGKKSP